MSTQSTAPQQAADRTLGGIGLTVTSVAAVQFGAATADGLILAVGAVGAVALRQLAAVVVMVGVSRPWRVRWNAADIRRSAMFGGILVVMNLSLYEAIARLPLATAITLEFLGPLVLSLVTARGLWQRLWALPAGAGVALLGGGLDLTDLVGVLFALTAAACWVGYILLARRIGQSGDPLVQLTVASALGAVILVPIAAFSAGAVLWHPQTLWIALVVGVLSSALPYSLDVLALRRLPTAVFGVLTSLHPAGGALAGWLVLDQVLPGHDLTGIGLIVLASIGTTITATRKRQQAMQRPTEVQPNAACT
ncbi:EamA family transporter [Nakamurella alba]|nr:EamA family transporter [Nakamurella alba]